MNTHAHALLVATLLAVMVAPFPCSGAPAVSVAPDPLDQWEVGVLPGMSTEVVQAVVFATGRFLATTAGATYVSTNGLTWVKVATTGGADLCFGNRRFVRVGGLLRVDSSTDGTTWRMGEPGPWYSYTGVAYGNGRFAAAGSRGEGIDFITSEDGLVWQHSFTSVFTGAGFGMAFGHGTFVYPYGGGVLWSTNGLDWHPSEARGGYGVAFGSGRFVGCALANAFQLSADGQRLLSEGRIQGLPDAQFFRIAYGNGVFVSVGSEGHVVTSRDGVSWVVRNSGVSDELWGVAFGAGRFLIGSSKGKILRSGIVPPAWSVPRVRPDQSLLLEDRTMLLTVEAPYGREVSVEASDDLAQWNLIATDPCTLGEFEVYDKQASSRSQRFYRVKQAPAP